ncbi:MAG: amidohydrolase [Candidatus Bathyarchaeia archaeon]
MNKVKSSNESFQKGPDLEYVTKRLKDLPKAVKDIAEESRKISRFIHSNPELGSEEHQAHALLVSKLKEHGISVDEKFLGMDTAFLGKVGNGDPKVAIFAEYDALPIGHACGHNLIAAWAYGVAAAFGDSGVPKGTLYIVGSPAEEGRGKYASSKVAIAPKLKELGIKAVFGVHPMGEWGVGGGALALTRLSFVFTGKDAHNAASPEQGVNALDAAVDFYIQLRMFRTLVKRDKDVIIGAVIVHGGVAPNIIPGKAEVWVDLRSNDSLYMKELEEKVKNIAEGAAKMTGSSVEYDYLGPKLDSMKRDKRLEELLFKHAKEYLPKVVSPDERWARIPDASGDLANVSQLIPTAQLLIKIGREGLPGHSEEWRDRAGSSEAEEALLTAIAIGYDSIREYLSEGPETE